MADENIRKLVQAILNYLPEVKSGQAKTRIRETDRQILIDFLIFAFQKRILWKDMFTFDTFIAFRKWTRFENTSHALIGLSGYLHENGKLSEPLHVPNYQVELPEIYEGYLIYLEQIKQITPAQINSVRRVLASFHHYLENQKLSLAALKIEHLDEFMAEFKVAKTTLRIYRYLLRGFLKYLYHPEFRKYIWRSPATCGSGDKIPSPIG